MNAQQEAQNNIIKHGAHNDNPTKLNKPNLDAGYGKILMALKILDPKFRKTQIQVAELIGRPIRSTTAYRYNPRTNREYYSKCKYFSTHGAWAALSAAKLIHKFNGSWSLTELGEKYVQEMM